MLSIMKNKREVTPLQMFLFVLIVIGAGIYCIASGVWGIIENDKQSLNQVFTQSFEKGNLFEGSVEVASPAFLEIDHKIDNLIPVGNEYYYLILSDDYSTAIAIRAYKNFGESFDSVWKSTEKVIIKGRIKELPDQAKTRLNEVKDTFSKNGLEFHIIQQYYIDTIGSNLYKLRIVLGISILLEVLLLYRIIRKNKFDYHTGSGKIAQIVGIVGVLVIFVLVIYLMTIK